MSLRSLVTESRAHQRAPFAEALAQLPILAAAQPVRDPSHRVLTLRA